MKWLLFSGLWCLTFAVIWRQEVTPKHWYSVPHYTTSPPRRPKPCYLPDSENQKPYRYDLVFLRKTETPLKTCRDDGNCCKQKCSEDDPKCNKDDLRPRRTSTSGMWSGLRMKINTFPELIPPCHEPDQSAGVLVSRRSHVITHFLNRSD
jgi:hypothetical protein